MKQMKTSSPLVRIDVLKKGARVGKRDCSNVQKIAGFVTSQLLNRYKKEYEVKKKEFSRIKNSHVVLNILITSPAGIKRINKQYRNKNKPTNVLSFSYITDAQDLIIQMDKSILLGEVILNWSEVLNDSGKNHNEKFEAISNLLSHSILHIFGYSHSDRSSLKIMESQKKEILNLINKHKSDLMEV